MTLFLALVACQSEQSFGVDPSSPPPPETRRTSPRTDVAERQGLCNPWCPGDALPGWPVAEEPDLSDLEGKPIIEKSLQPVEAAVWACDDIDGPLDCGQRSPSWFGLFFSNCEDDTCDWDEDEWWYLMLYHEDAAAPKPLGLGWWDMPADDGGAFVYTFYKGQEGYSGFENCDNERGVDEGYICQPGRAYLTEVRPDRIRGLVYIDTTEMEFGDENEGYVYMMRFEMPFPPHGGYGMRPRYQPGNAGHRYYVYSDSQPYNEMWPWESISDPDIRTTVFRTYHPYLWPYYP